MASNGHPPHTATSFKAKTQENLSELQGLADNIHGLITAHMAATNASSAKTQETLSSLAVLLRNLTKELADAREAAVATNKRLRQLQLMSTHAALYGTLHPTAYPDDSRENRLLIHMCKMYKIIPCEFDHSGGRRPQYEQAQEAQEVLGYLLLGYEHLGHSFVDLSCV